MDRFHNREVGILMLRRAAIVCLLFCAVAPVVSQTIRVTVDLVQVDAVVTDENGLHIPDLRAEDFQTLKMASRRPSPTSNTSTRIRLRPGRFQRPETRQELRRSRRLPPHPRR